MRLRFSKMHSLGEDFVIIDGLTQHVRLTADAVRLLADRKLGIGCQRVILVEPPGRPDMDFRCRLLNRDGSQSSEDAIGPAACLAHFVWERRLTAQRELRVETLQGPAFTVTAGDDGLIAVDWDLTNIIKEAAARQTLMLGEDRHELITVALDQHYAILKVAAAGDAPVKALGRRIQQHPQLPAGTNVGFMAVLSRREIDLRVLHNSGTEVPATASTAVAAVIAGRYGKLLDDEVDVRTRGGRLTLRWQGEDKPLRVSSPAVAVYQGQIQL